MKPNATSSRGRVSARPAVPKSDRPAAGLQALALDKRRDALLYIPQRSSPANRPLPLVVSLHGAGGNERHGIDLLKAQADAAGVALLSPASRRETWDVIVGGFGPDVDFINSALQLTFDRCSIDAERLAIGGFSDGASYALTLGLANGDLFTNVLAFSPGFTAHPSTAGKPSIFVSHGTRDAVLPIDHCSRRLVPRLRAAGYEVDYREFDGPHMVPAELATTAVEQLVARPGKDA
ncbi:MAG TPA: phospholipase [Bryobacteraceae bacterium]|nr:phospholipase [Bryobacteraceae bacterium]